MRWGVSGLVVGALVGGASIARADEPTTEPAQVDLTKDTAKPKVDDPTAPPPEAPPPPPYKNTLVVDSTIGTIAFLGQFRKIAPPGFWLHTQLGYELFKWLMLYGEGE